MIVEAVGGVAVLLLIIVGIMLWNKAKDAAWKKVNQNIIFRGTHRDGQDIVSRRLDYTSNASPAVILEAMSENLGVPVGVQSAVLGRVYVSAVTDNHVSFTSGSKVGASFSSAITAVEHDLGSTGTYRVLRWTESDGIISDVDQMTIIETKIREHLLSIDPAVTLRVETDEKV